MPSNTVDRAAFIALFREAELLKDNPRRIPVPASIEHEGQYLELMSVGLVKTGDGGCEEVEGTSLEQNAKLGISSGVANAVFIRETSQTTPSYLGVLMADALIQSCEMLHRSNVSNPNNLSLEDMVQEALNSFTHTAACWLGNANEQVTTGKLELIKCSDSFVCKVAGQDTHPWKPDNAKPIVDPPENNDGLFL